MTYSHDVIEHIKQRIRELFRISTELEQAFPGRKFTLDGHLIGSIGEVIAAYHYGLDLLPSSTEQHDAIAPDGRLVQIKATQGRHHIALRSEPEHLIVLWIDDNTGEAQEVYNGPGAPVWEACGKRRSTGTRPIAMSKLEKLAAQIPQSQRLEPINPYSVGKRE